MWLIGYAWGDLPFNRTWQEVGVATYVEGGVIIYIYIYIFFLRRSRL